VFVELCCHNDPSIARSDWCDSSVRDFKKCICDMSTATCQCKQSELRLLKRDANAVVPGKTQYGQTNTAITSNIYTTGNAGNHDSYYCVLFLLIV
jgi:hypothetical protein